MRAALIAVVLVGSVAWADRPARRARPAAPADALVLVIDRSGSMMGPRIAEAKRAALAAASALRPADRLAVVAFDTSAEVLVPLQPSRNRTAIAKDVDRLAAGGGTHVRLGIEEANRVLAGVTARKKHVIVLSDGETPTEGITELVKGMRKHGITISTVAIPGADVLLLKQISDEGGGRMYEAKDLTKLSKVLVDEAKLALK